MLKPGNPSPNLCVVSGSCLSLSFQSNFPACQIVSGKVQADRQVNAKYSNIKDSGRARRGAVLCFANGRGGSQDIER